MEGLAWHVECEEKAFKLAQVRDDGVDSSIGDNGEKGWKWKTDKYFAFYKSIILYPEVEKKENGRPDCKRCSSKC